MTFNIVKQARREWDEPVRLGKVTHADMSKDEGYQLIQKLWDEFQFTLPDSDSQFIQYLTKHGFVEVSDDETDVFV